MKLLLDECVDERLRFSFSDHDCSSVRFAKLAGLENGSLLNAAEAARFDVLGTVDQSISNQQNMTGRSLSILVLRAKTNRLRDLLKLINAANEALRSIGHGDVITIS